MKIYLAGPDVFYPDAKYIGKRKQQLCANHGAIGLFPLDNEIDLRQDDAAYTIFLANKSMMDEADCCIANLTPFRGPSADVGTVLEMGYMIGQGKPVFGYSNHPWPYMHRVHNKEYDVNGAFDEDGNFVEDFGLQDNIMIDCFLRQQGFTFIVPDWVVKPSGNPMDYTLNTFIRCLKSAVDNMNFRKRMP